VFADLGNDVIAGQRPREDQSLGPAGCPSTSRPRGDGGQNTDDRRLSFTTDPPPASVSRTWSSSKSARHRKNSARPISRKSGPVATEIGRAADRYKVIVNKSTVPVGTGEFVRGHTSPAAPIDFDVVSNEFMR
jgi:UDPglucose 6-dehydrogenase